jgi:hypothetical protein
MCKIKFLNKYLFVKSAFIAFERGVLKNDVVCMAVMMLEADVK